MILDCNIHYNARHITKLSICHPELRIFRRVKLEVTIAMPTTNGFSVGQNP